MSNIDKRALREVAEKVNSGDWSYEEFNRLDLPGGSFVKIDGRDAVYCLNRPVGGIKQSRAVIAFIATFNPKVALALLDELDSANGYASAYEAEKWHYHGLAESEGERADRVEKQVEELTMWVKRLAHSLRNARPNSKLHGAAMDYLSHKGLISVEDVLR
ncbi:ead/Ea22-like family protein [Salmonella enterica subsp. enterica serovar Thompson]|nr:ead/Ea22-like family protein [Salmonella enterica]EAY8295805.1 ead/Ea22-like family protein [Salmonella enterica]EEJ5538035.1 ead/Ea22-like family protein [Salmonella enterica subsp. enterica serovar Thompson]HCM1851756.1 ead/Ea22-like family protein [Salmonella enterica subsp. salamae serovar 42:z29:-]